LNNTYAQAENIIQEILKKEGLKWLSG
jgi:hypothetical protein